VSQQNVKMINLAHELIERFHGHDKADKAKSNFISRFQNKNITDDIPLIELKTVGGLRIIDLIINNLKSIDSDIDQVMDGWRLKRLPRIDRDILRLAYVDINFLNTPVAVACDEAVNLANKYSDLQGRKFINGVLRRLQSI